MIPSVVPPDFRGFGVGLAILRAPEKSPQAADVIRSRPHLRMQSGEPVWCRSCHTFFGLCARARFGPQNCQPSQNLNRSTMLQICIACSDSAPLPRLTQNLCYQPWILLSCSLSQLLLVRIFSFINSCSVSFISAFEVAFFKIVIKVFIVGLIFLCFNSR